MSSLPDTTCRCRVIPGTPITSREDRAPAPERAVAGGLCLGSLGEDTAGSIRNPSAFCGIAGLKATYGRVSRYGLAPLSWSLDHCGPMARLVEDLAHMLKAIAGHDPKRPDLEHRPTRELWKRVA